MLRTKTRIDSMAIKVYYVPNFERSAGGVVESALWNCMIELGPMESLLC